MKMGRTMSVLTGIAAGMALSQMMNDKSMKMVKRAWNRMM
ncbi:MAG: hypothetical protein K0R71_2018 [Bacillales bacterium]|jgi:hypothetical protein|nr:hypothetical protein [Bacillales bacterium]